MFAFSDPAPPDRFLLDRSFQKKPDSPFGDDQAGVLISVVRMSAALAANLTWLGLGGPSVRVNMCGQMFNFNSMLTRPNALLQQPKIAHKRGQGRATRDSPNGCLCRLVWTSSRSSV